MQPNRISKISVSGYKSIADEQSIGIAPLTIFAGANSSGKSSIIQPLLLLKQTLEATYDPKGLLMNGPNVKFTSVDQLLSIGNNKKVFTIGIEQQAENSLKIFFKGQEGKGFDIEEMFFQTRNEPGITLKQVMTSDDIEKIVPSEIKEIIKRITKEEAIEWRIVKQRCFLGYELVARNKDKTESRYYSSSPADRFESLIRRLIHIPGLRGNPTRAYPMTSAGPLFPGTFEQYTASVIARWAENKDEKLKELGNDLKFLGLTWKVTAHRINETEVELKVGRLKKSARGGSDDLVNIADVGFGVSQTLPILVALRMAEPGQIVYIEQPEIHLHPRAQYAMATILAEAAERGVTIIAETHSSLLLLGLRTLVAKKNLSHDKVRLHWFERDDKGCTHVVSADIDENGSFGEWPEDFGAVELEAESQFLDSI
jgi:predicted ATPase